jgi:hypothetical protein
VHNGGQVATQDDGQMASQGTIRESRPADLDVARIASTIFPCTSVTEVQDSMVGFLRLYTQIPPCVKSCVCRLTALAPVYIRPHHGVS